MANTDFSVLLKAVLDKSGIDTELKQVQEIVKKYSVAIMPELQTASLRNQMKAVAKDIANDFNKAFGTNLTGNDVYKAFEAQAKAVKQVTKEQENLTKSMAKVREQAELARREEEKRQQIAQSKAINKALDEEYQKRQKNIEASKKQAEAIRKQEEADRKYALNYTKNASKKLSGAVSKYSQGDSKDAEKMIKQMNRGVSNFGNLDNVERDAKRLDAIIDGIIDKLKKSHSESIKAVEAEIKAEQEKAKIVANFNKQQDKNIPNGIDADIEKRKQDSKRFSSELEKSMNIRQSIDSGSYDAELKTVEASFRNLGLEADEVEGKIREVKAALDNLKSPADGQSMIALDEKFTQELDKAKNSAKALKTNMEGIYNPQKQSSLKNDISNWLSKNTAATAEARQKLQQYLDLLSNGKVNVATLKKIQKEIKDIDASERKTGNLGKSFFHSIGDEMKSFARWSLSSALIMKPIQMFRESIAVMKEVDSELVNIQKVTNATADEMKKLTKEAYAMATAYGRAPTEFLKSVTAFSRAGYGDTASELGELSMLSQNVGDINEEVADGFLLAADAAWQYGGNVDDLRRILDGFNELSNQTATDVEKLAEGIKVSGSVFAQAGLSAQDYAGIIGTATAKTQLSGNEMSRAWRTILMNIRQIKGTDLETGEIIDDDKLAKAEKTLKEIGINVREVVNGQNELRNPMQIITELADKWKDLSSVQQAAVQEALAGRLLPERIEICA